MTKKVAITILLLLLTGCATSKPQAYPHEPCHTCDDGRMYTEDHQRVCGDLSVNPVVVALWLIVGGGYGR